MKQKPVSLFPPGHGSQQGCIPIQVAVDALGVGQDKVLDAPWGPLPAGVHEQALGGQVTVGPHAFFLDDGLGIW